MIEKKLNMFYFRQDSCPIHFLEVGVELNVKSKEIAFWSPRIYPSF